MSGLNGTIRHPPAFSFGSISRLRVSHSELFSDAFTGVNSGKLHYTECISAGGTRVRRWRNTPRPLSQEATSRHSHIPTALPEWTASPNRAHSNLAT